MGTRFASLALLILLLLPPPPAAAQTAARKFVRGLAGMTTAFLEVPGNMYAESEARGPAEGVPLGFAIGLGMIVPRVLVGVYEFLSAPFEAPPGFRPILEPEFPWSYFDERGSGATAPPPPPPPPPKKKRRHA